MTKRSHQRDVKAPTALPGGARRAARDNRRGVIVVLTGFVLTVLFAFVSMSVDSGRIVLTETEMQNAVDAAALAASQEITAAIHAAGQGTGSATIDANSIAVEAARTMAAQVAAANGVYVDPAADVSFGKRNYDAASDSWPIQWGAAPYNVVRVVARRNNADDPEAPDSELPLAFGWAVGRTSVPLTTSATAFVEARDLVLVLDFSGSMSDDTELRSIGTFTQQQVEDGLDQCWQELRASKVKWPGVSPARNKWKHKFGGIDSAEGVYISSSDTDDIFDELDLGAKYGKNHARWPGTLKWPFPQSGRGSDGLPNGMLSDDDSEDAWKDYIHYVKNLGGPYKKKYGFRTLIDYLLQNNQMEWDESEDLWRTSHYPFHAVKNGASLFLGFLSDLDFGDEIGLVSYGTYAVWEDSHHDGEVSIDLGGDPITSDYAAVDTIQRRHQAGHYDVFTGIGDGVLKAREMLVGRDNDSSDEGHARYGARPTIILMTDGQANRMPSGWNMPSGFDWDDHTDYDGDGQSDYSTSDSKKKYAFYEALECAKRGITVHTMAVGAGADRGLMRAIAHACGGVHISVPGGSTIAEMESQMLEAFGEIAAKVPPAQLVYELSAPAGGN
ncbi:MAG: pilus assembly protein TadG-related protein [Planctomycetota bacterium]